MPQIRPARPVVMQGSTAEESRENPLRYGHFNERG